MECIACGRQFHWECPSPTDNNCCCSLETKNAKASASTGEETNKVGRPLKEEITISAGRKRAATAYPLEEGQPCDWRGLANCGGGIYPIIGCLTGIAVNRHHGPVKDTSRNEESNIHRICAGCHNLWHAKNDPVYREDVFNLLTHDPRPATPSEMLQRGKS